MNSLTILKGTRTDCPEILPIALGLVHLIVMSFALIIMETSFIVKIMNHIRSMSSLVVNAPALHRSNLMTPLERIFSEGDARLKMTVSWELVELEDGPQGRGMKWAINSPTFDNVYLIWLSCASWRSAKTSQLKLSTPAISRLLLWNRHFKVVKLIFTAIYHSATSWSAII